MRKQISLSFLLLLLLSFLAGGAMASLANGHGQGGGSCTDPAIADCDPDFDDEVSLMPHNYDFGGVPVGTEAQPMSYALVNTSGVEVQVGTIQVSGDGMHACQAIGCPVIADDEFFLVSDECSGNILADQASCELEVGFLPTAEGEYLSGLWVPYTPVGGEMQTIRGKLGGAGYVDDGAGFTLSGAIYLFQKPSTDEILARIQTQANDHGVALKKPDDVPAGPKPQIHVWQPVGGVTVTLDNGLTTLTNDAGEYHFVGLDKGNYSVTPTSEGFRFFPAVRHTHVNSRDRQGIDFRAREMPVETE